MEFSGFGVVKLVKPSNLSILHNLTTLRIVLRSLSIKSKVRDREAEVIKTKGVVSFENSGSLSTMMGWWKIIPWRGPNWFSPFNRKTGGSGHTLKTIYF